MCKPATLRISHQEIDSDSYLKTAVCYVLKNAPSGGLPFNAIDYPWSSGPLMFRRSSYWSSPGWTDGRNLSFLAEMQCKDQREILGTHKIPDISVKMTGDIVFPGEYIPYKTVEKVFGSHKSFNYFMSRTKESDVESRNGEISRAGGEEILDALFFAEAADEEVAALGGNQIAIKAFREQSAGTFVVDHTV